MNNYVIFVIFTVLLSAVTPDVTNPRFSKQYRSDYVYNHETDAFYKLHIEMRPQWRSSKACSVEGAKLMDHDSEQDIIQLHSMFKKFPDLGEYVWVADDGKEHESAEEQPILVLNPTPDSDYDWRPTGRRPPPHCVVVDRNGAAETAPCYRRYPFICKVNATDAPYDAQCGVYGTGYKYFASTGSCYRIPRLPYTWSEAYSECEVEGSHLVVINSVLEHDVVHKFTMNEDPVSEAKMSWYFFAGFRADKPPKNTNTTVPPRVFKTIFNQTLEQAGYSLWSDTEPNNIDGHEYCGTIYLNDGKFNDINCDHEYPFICEKEVQRS